VYGLGVIALPHFREWCRNFENDGGGGGGGDTGRSRIPRTDLNIARVEKMILENRGSEFETNSPYLIFDLNSKDRFLPRRNIKISGKMR
jgi:hypothetical protein